jgi:hypothetical protein
MLNSSLQSTRRQRIKFCWCSISKQKSLRMCAAFARFKCGVAFARSSSYNYNQFSNILHVSDHLHSVVNHYNVLFGFPIARISSTEPKNLCNCLNFLQNWRVVTVRSCGNLCQLIRSGSKFVFRGGKFSLFEEKSTENPSSRVFQVIHK